MMFPSAGRSRLLTLLIACWACGAGCLTSACAEPPNREMDQAQGAIDAARAAGADRYAAEEYQAAVSALKQAQDAVGLQDYRLALNHALDSRERAQNAAQQAADRGTAQRSQAERALGEAAAMLDHASMRLAEAEAARVPRRALAAPGAAVTDALVAVQKAGTAIQRGDYQAAAHSMAETSRKLQGMIDELNTVMKGRSTPLRR